MATQTASRRQALNVVHLVGEVRTPPDLKYLADGKAVIGFSLGIPPAKNAKDQTTQWFRVGAFEELAERVAKAIKQGDIVYVEGSIKGHAWIDKTGAARQSLDVTAWRIELA